MRLLIAFLCLSGALMAQKAGDLSVEKLADDEISLLAKARDQVARAEAVLADSKQDLAEAENIVKIYHRQGLVESEMRPCGNMHWKSVELRGEYALVTLDEVMSCGGGNVTVKPDHGIFSGPMLPVIPGTNSWKDSVMQSWEYAAKNCNAYRQPDGELRWYCVCTDPAGCDLKTLQAWPPFSLQ